MCFLRGTNITIAILEFAIDISKRPASILGTLILRTNHQYPVDRGLCGPQSRCWRCLWRGAPVDVLGHLTSFGVLLAKGIKRDTCPRMRIDWLGGKNSQCCKIVDYNDGSLISLKRILYIYVFSCNNTPLICSSIDVFFCVWTKYTQQNKRI
jgi:hypothetical protein